MSLFKIPLLAAALGFLLPSASYASNLTGDTIQVNYDFPTVGTVYEGQSFTFIAPGSETIFGEIIIDVTATQITIGYSASPSYLGGSFNGFQITDLTNPLLGATLDASSTLTPVAFDLTNGVLSVNFEGEDVNTSSKTVFDIASASPTPQPGSLALLGTGMLGIVGVARLRFMRQIHPPVN